MRQPVHVDDLAAACVGALDAESAFGRAYNLGGGERLTYVEMVRRIFIALDLPPRIAYLAPGLFRLLVRLLRKIPRYGFVDEEMVMRISEDMVVDFSDATRDFNFSPRAFHPSAEEIQRLS